MNKRTTEKGFLHFPAEGHREVLFYTKEETYVYDTLRDFVLSESDSYRGRAVFLREDMFKAVLQYLERNNYEISVKKIRNTTKCIFYSFEGESNRQKKTFYSLKYKTGTDEYDSILDILDQIDAAPTHSASGYTGILRKILTTPEHINEFTAVERVPSTSPLIYVKPRKEFFNVKCYDAASFYPYMYTQELPHYDKIITKEEMDLNNKNYTYYGTITIHNIHVNKSYLATLSLRGNGSKGVILSKQDKNVQHDGTALISADTIVLNGFIPFLLEELQDYTYSHYEIDKKIARFILKPSEEISKQFLSKFAAKQAKKRAGEYYLPEKILLNRGHGYFITKGCNTAAHFGQYVIAKGKIILRRLAIEMGVKDVVHMHTDSIKFVGDHEDVIERYNATIPFEELGKFAYEGTMERVVYYNKIVAKYIMNGRLCFKHGGISEKDIIPLKKKNYEEITKDTPINITLGHFYTDEAGLIPYRSKGKLGGRIYE